MEAVRSPDVHNQENILKVLAKTPGGPEIIKKAEQGKDAKKK